MLHKYQLLRSSPRVTVIQETFGFDRNFQTCSKDGRIVQEFPHIHIYHLFPCCPHIIFPLESRLSENKMKVIYTPSLSFSCQSGQQENSKEATQNLTFPEERSLLIFQFLLISQTLAPKQLSFQIPFSLFLAINEIWQEKSKSNIQRSEDLGLQILKTPEPRRSILKSSNIPELVKYAPPLISWDNITHHFQRIAGLGKRKNA